MQVLHAGREIAPGGVEVVDPADPGIFGAAVVAAAQQAEDVLFVYYVGHGLVSARNELHLATRATQDLTRGIAAYQALPYEQIRQVLAESRAALTVIVLDCCFSGRAQGAARTEVSEVFASLRHGMYLLTSTNRDEAAWAPPDRPHTAFSGALIELLGEGEPTAPGLLTLDDVHRCLSRNLLEQGFPEPRRQAAGHGDRLPFAPNPAHSRSRRAEQAGQAEQEGQFSPYRGLAAFGPQDARFFFGRADLTQRLLDRFPACNRGSIRPDIGPSRTMSSAMARLAHRASTMRAAAALDLVLVTQT